VISPAGDVQIAFRISLKARRRTIVKGGELIGVHSAPRTASICALANYPMPGVINLMRTGVRDKLRKPYNVNVADGVCPDTTRLASGTGNLVNRSPGPTAMGVGRDKPSF